MYCIPHVVTTIEIVLSAKSRSRHILKLHPVGKEGGLLFRTTLFTDVE